MPTRRRVIREETPNEYDPQTLSVSVPDNPFIPFLVILLMLVSFLLGMTLNQLQNRNGTALGLGGGTPPSQAVGQNGQTAPSQPTPTPGKVDVALGHFPAKGDKNAKVKIVEFADFRCPFCEKYFTDTESQILKDYVDTGKASYSFRQYAFLGPASTVAANAAECANDQGKFWEYHDYLYKNQPPESDTTLYTTDTLTQAATTLGMNGDQFKSCLDSKKFDSKATQDFSDGQKAGVTGTPTVFVNGIPVVGAQPYSAFKTIIDQELAK